VWTAGQHLDAWDFLRFNLRGYSGIAKIVAEPPNSITDFWICIASPVTSFVWVILHYLVQPITHTSWLQTMFIDGLPGAVIKPSQFPRFRFS